jgi:hypothetical protein
MNSASRGLWPVVGLRRPGKAPFASAEADAWRGAPWGADFNRRQGLRPVGRPARRMNSASRGLWPVVGLRRPGKAPFASAEADAWRAASGRADFNRRQGLRPVGRPARRMNSASRGLWPSGRPTPTWKSTFCVGGGRRLARSALRGRFQSAPRPSAGGSPAPTGKAFFASAEADAWRAAPEEADFNRRQRPSAGGSPTPTGRRSFCVGGGRRPARSALRGRFQSAFKADAWRGAPLKADFNRHPGGAPDSPFSRSL